ncbi:MAG: glycosyltransferase [Acidobacteriota bacterium]|nr:glycosyltransferase [Acidobacteriota bacterium]
MGASVKPHIVLSGVNLMDMGPLAVFREALTSLAETHGDRYDIVALVHRKSLFDTPGVTYFEFPEVKSSWLRRLRFEYADCWQLSKKLRPELWLSMHDMTPNVKAKCQAVYCHNPSIFHRFSLNEARLDWKFGLFTLFYRFLYRINLKKNKFVIVQQDWMRDVFKVRYRLDNVVVAHPGMKSFDGLLDGRRAKDNGKYCFFYPAFPRVFKNFEVIFEAARLLEHQGFDNFKVWLTTDAVMNNYARKIAREYVDVKSVECLGPLPRDQVFKRYAEADCLLFPSKLETWGMPITEFKATGKPILAADLPYAHETVGDYDKVAFFDRANASELASLMKSAVLGLPVFGKASAAPIAPLFSRNWEELWCILLEPSDASSPR